MVRQMTPFPIKLVEIIISLFSCLCQTKLFFCHLSRNLQKCKFNMVYHRVLSDLRRINSWCNGFAAGVKPLRGSWLWGPLRWLLTAVFPVIPHLAVFSRKQGKIMKAAVVFLFFVYSHRFKVFQMTFVEKRLFSLFVSLQTAKKVSEKGNLRVPVAMENLGGLFSFGHKTTVSSLRIQLKR